MQDATTSTQREPILPDVRSFWKSVWNFCEAVQKIRIQKRPRALRVEESLALGERRFLTVVDWNGERLLLGVTPHHIALLERREVASEVQEPST